MEDDHYIKKIISAYEIIKQKKLTTPLVKLHNVTTPQSHSIYLKAECLQPGGSFKIRGVSYAISKLTPEQRAIGVVAYSTGNHAQAVALAARELGVHAVIVMSPNVPIYKIEATQNYGAEIVITEPESRIAVTEELVKNKGYYYIPPFDREDVIEGQGTIGLEILEQIDTTAVFVPVGGGGLISGIALAIKHFKPDIQIIGVEPEFENDTYQSFKSGKRVKINTTSQTIADAIRVPVGELTLGLITKYVDDILTVSEEQIAQATLLCIRQAHLWVEPAGALGVAGALHYRGNFATGKPIVCVASGGNMSIEFICQLLKLSPPTSPPPLSERFM